jgi:hypothetical protein
MLDGSGPDFRALENLVGGQHRPTLVIQAAANGGRLARVHGGDPSKTISNYGKKRNAAGALTGTRCGNMLGVILRNLP